MSSMLAFSAGGLLALMVFFNGTLAKYIRPLEASLVIHLVGLATSLLLVLLWKHRGVISFTQIPKWVYVTGMFGGIAVATVGVTVCAASGKLSNATAVAWSAADRAGNHCSLMG